MSICPCATLHACTRPPPLRRSDYEPCRRTQTRLVLLVLTCVICPWYPLSGEPINPKWLEEFSFSIFAPETDVVRFEVRLGQTHTIQTPECARRLDGRHSSHITPHTSPHQATDPHSDQACSDQTCSPLFSDIVVPCVRGCVVHVCERAGFRRQCGDRNNNDDDDDQQPMTLPINPRRCGTTRSCSRTTTTARA